MGRFEDSPELFGGGVGVSTGFEIHCDWCGVTHNEDTDEEDMSTEGDSVRHTDFAGKQICDCCFEGIEREILRRMRDILPWYERILAHRRGLLVNAENNVDAVKQVSANCGIASELIREMGRDNGCSFAYTDDQYRRMVEAVGKMRQSGVAWSEKDIGEIAAGEETERDQKYSGYDGYPNLSKVMDEIFDNSTTGPSITNWLNEGMVKKGGVNKKPTTSPPPPPQGQGE